MADWMTALPPAAQLYLEGKRLDEIECIISDLPGIARGKAGADSLGCRRQIGEQRQLIADAGAAQPHVAQPALQHRQVAGTPKTILRLHGRLAFIFVPLAQFRRNFLQRSHPLALVLKPSSCAFTKPACGYKTDFG